MVLTPRNVVNHVAARHGKLKDIILEAEEKLEQVRDGSMELTDLETDRDRVRLRAARESSSVKRGLERINQTNNFQDKNVIDKIALKANSVCRILKNGRGWGTGFLVGDDVIMTNNHVISSPEEASSMSVEFEFELSINDVSKQPSSFKLDPQKFFLTSILNTDPSIPFSGLDFTLVGIQRTGINGEQLSKFQSVPIDGNKGKIIKGESCVIIQHPNGEQKKIVLKDTAFFFETATKIVYESDTLPGSSGSMVLGLGTCEVVALHHSGLPRTNEKGQILTKQGRVADDSTRDEDIDWIGNEGIKISKIIEALENAVLPQHMENIKAALLRKTERVAEELSQATHIATNPVNPVVPIKPVSTVNISKDQPPTKTNTMTPVSSSQSLVDFIITAVNSADVIKRVESMLSSRYGKPIQVNLLMPGSAALNQVELFSFSVAFTGNVHQEANELRSVPEIINAEADVPLALNADTQFEPPTGRPAATESGFLFDDGTGEWLERKFLIKYKESPYVDELKLDTTRKWNWAATGFDQLDYKKIRSPKEAGIRIVQFDTGYTDHPKVVDGYDLDEDYNFLTDTTDAMDPRTVAIGKQPGHGTRTGSLLIGARPESDPTKDHNGNEGLLSPVNYKLVPFRIAETVVIINRQQQLAAALDRAIIQGFDIITMSMGLPPTIATAKMAKKAYDKGIIWCCAAGNEVQAVVAPAVFPGTIAVAASNPLDYEWKGSSRGPAVDITAPGEDVYVPIWNKQQNIDYAYGNGTSYATPHVAAAAAYWLAAHQKHLNHPDYAGWKRVAAFKEALKESARRENNLPKVGFGHGMLHIESLLKTKPVPAAELKYAYNNWNENAFFATLQGVSDIVKTYWNKIHGLFAKTKRGGQESLIPTESLSNTSQELERILFNGSVSQFESAGGDLEKNELIARYNTLQNIIDSNI